jgi:hypothetical protein
LWRVKVTVNFVAMSPVLQRIVPYISSPSRALRYAEAVYNESRWRGSDWGLLPAESIWKIDPSLRDSITIGWPRLGGKPTLFTATLKQAFTKLFPVVELDLPTTDLAHLQFEVRVGDRRIPVFLDFRDNPTLVQDYVASPALYIKMQFREEGYSERKVIPGGYLTGLELILPALDQLRERRDRSSDDFDVYGRFGLHSAEGIRREAVTTLSSQSDFDFEGGVEIVRFGQYLLEMARAKVCLDLPGRGAFCYRLVDYLAVGSCIVSVRHRNKLPVALRDGHDVAFVDEDLSNLLEVTRFYLSRPNERRKLIRNSREFFDLYMHPVQLVRYYVTSALAWQG